MIPYLFVFMKQQRIHKVQREKERLRKEFREMMILLGIVYLQDTLLKMH